MLRGFGHSSPSAKQLPDAAFVELVDIVFRSLLPVAVMGVTIMGVGVLLAIRTSDVSVLALTIGGGLVAVGRTALILTYRRRSAVSALSAEEARVWEGRYAIGSFAFAILLGALNARVLMIEQAPDAMLSPMLATGLIFGYGSGVVTRMAVRPALCVTSLMLATAPTVVGFGVRVAAAEGVYATAAFAAQTMLIAGFAIASLESVAEIYATTRRHLLAKLELAVIAGQDDLTGLPNRVQLRERFDEAGARIRGTGDLLAVHCLDLDEFKAVNDTFGHLMGDMLLRAVTKRLLRTVREEDTVARSGGDEFVVIQTGIRDADEASLLARRIIRVIDAPYRLDGREMRIGVSIGIALAPQDGLDLDRIVSCADAALYRAKRGGRGGVAFWKEPPAPGVTTGT